MEEELRELKSELKTGNKKKIKEEIGDFLFTSAHLARLLGTDPEVSLLAANRKFQRRFRKMEDLAQAAHQDMAQLGLRGLEKLWKKAKRELR